MKINFKITNNIVYIRAAIVNNLPFITYEKNNINNFIHCSFCTMNLLKIAQHATGKFTRAGQSKN
jgi:hypothetical protein